MDEPRIEFASPVDWPRARPRTALRKDALWRHDGRRVTFDIALGRLREQIRAVTPNGKHWRMRELTLSTNFDLRNDGRFRRDRGAPADPGVAFFFELDGEPHVLACDRWNTVADNVAAIAAHIDSLRGQERWGVADMRQAFAGHVALPAPEQWWQVLGIDRDATLDQVNTAYRTLAKRTHGDTGGSDAAMSRLNVARDAATTAIGDAAR